MVTYLFDSTFPGLLTAVFESYAARQKEINVIPAAGYQPGFPDTAVTITSDPEKAQRVWDGLGKRIGNAGRYEFYTAFFSESSEAWQHMFGYARYIFDHGGERAADYGNRHVLAIATYARKVGRERHRMKAFVRFKKGMDGLYAAVVEPDFNVLPLIAGHFRDRYADQRWMIFDKRRRYGIYYDLTFVQEVKIEPLPAGASRVAAPAAMLPDENDSLYTSLWQEYFKSTNIKERANLKLHIQHVPRRYWKHLPEKEPGFL